MASLDIDVSKKLKAAYAVKGKTEINIKNLNCEIESITATGNTLSVLLENGKVIKLTGITDTSLTIKVNSGEIFEGTLQDFYDEFSDVAEFVRDKKGVYTGSVFDEEFDFEDSEVAVAINAGDGNDTLIGGVGNDTLTGGKTGEDWFVFESGRGVDTVTDAGKGDIIYISDVNGEDLKFVQNGKDLEIFFDDNFEAGDENNKIIVQKYFSNKAGQFPTIMAQDGIVQNIKPIFRANGKLTATAGDDEILGSANKDTINAGDGNDVIYASAGDDVLTGGSGTNEIIYKDTDGAQYNTDTIKLTKNENLIINLSDFGLSKNNLKDSLSISGKDLLITLGDDKGTIKLANFASVNTVGADGSVKVRLENAVGNPEEEGYIPPVDVDLNTEALIEYSADDLNGKTSFTGTRLSEIIDMSDSDLDLTITGGDGNDSISGGYGNDILKGGAGADIFVFTPGNGVDTIADAEKIDKIHVVGVDDADAIEENLRFEKNGTNLEIYTNGDDEESKIIVQKYFSAKVGQAIDEIVDYEGNVIGKLSEIKFNLRGQGAITGTSKAEHIIGSDLDDVIKANGGNDEIDAGEGNDKIYCVSGNNTINLYYGDGVDTVFAGTGNDTIVFNNMTTLDELNGVELYSDGTNLKIVYSDLGDAVIIDKYETSSVKTIQLASENEQDAPVTCTLAELLANHDVYRTGQGKITGTAGNDTIIGSSVNDTITGGTGENIYVFGSEKFGNDTINLTETENAIIDFSDLEGVNGENLGVSFSGNNLVIKPADYGQVTITNFKKSDITGNEGSVIVKLANSEIDLKEKLYSVTANANYTGSWLSEEIDASNAKKGLTINARGGNDVIKAGAKADTFVFIEGDGKDRIVNATYGDKIQINSVVDAEDINFSKSNNDLVINYSENDSITLKDFYTKDDNLDVIMLKQQDGKYQTVLISENIEYEKQISADYTKTSVYKERLVIADVPQNIKISGLTSSDTVVMPTNDELNFTRQNNDALVINDRVTVNDFFNGADFTVEYGENSVNTEDAVINVTLSDNFAYNSTKYAEIISGEGSVTYMTNEDKLLVDGEPVYTRTNNGALVVNDTLTVSDFNFDGQHNINVNDGTTADMTLNVTLTDGFAYESTAYAERISGQGSVTKMSANDRIITEGAPVYSRTNNGGLVINDVLTVSDFNFDGQHNINVNNGTTAGITLNVTLTGGFAYETTGYTEIISGNGSVSNLGAADRILFNQNAELNYYLSQDGLSVTDGVSTIVVSDNLTGSVENTKIYRGNVLDDVSGKTLTVSGFSEFDGSALPYLNYSVTGTKNADDLTGGNGNDTISGGLGNDIISGGAGNNVLVFEKGDGNDVIVDGDGVDTIKFNEEQELNFVHNIDTKELTIYYGTNDSITLTNCDMDYIHSVSSIINGEETVSLVNAMENYGVEYLVGATGEYTFENNNIPAVLNLAGSLGGATYTKDMSNNDLIITNQNRVITLKGYFENNSHSVESFIINDTEFGVNTIVGAKGLIIRGTADGEIVTGTNYGDEIISGQGADTINGGLGNNILRFKAGDGNDVIVNGGGVDTITFDSDVEVSYAHNVLNNDLVISYGENDSIALKDYFAGGHSVRTIKIGEQTFNLATAISNNINEIYDFAHGCELETITANGGADSLLFAGDVTYVHNVNNNDLIIKYGDNKSVKIVGYYTGNHSVKFINGVEIANAIANNVNEIYDYAHGCTVTEIAANGGVDSLLFADGTNFVYERTFPSNDLVIKYNNNNLTLKDYFAGNHSVTDINGTEIATLIANNVNEIYDFANGCEVAEITSNGGVDTLKFAKNTELTYTHGLANNDLIINYGENQSVTLKDYFLENHSVQTIQIGNATLNIENALENGMTIIGTENADVITGTSGNDIISGSAGNDTITGGLGNDTITGGQDYEDHYNVLTFNVGDGQDTILNSGGYDTIVINGATFDDLSYTKSDNDLIITYSKNDNITVKDFFTGMYTSSLQAIKIGDTTKSMTEAVKLYFNGTDGDDVITGTYYNDIISGGAGNDTIDGLGGLGKDIIDGGDGNDVITVQSYNTVNGGAGDDIIYGEAGNTITGGLGNDTIAGGNWNTYIFNAGDGNDVVLNGGGIDTLVLPEGTDLTYIHNVLNNDLIISYGQNDNITVKDYFAGGHSVQAVKIGDETFNLSDLIANNVNEIYDFAHGCNVNEIVSNGGVDSLVFAGGVTYVHDVNNDDLVINYGDNKTVTISDYFAGNHSVQFINGVAVANAIANNVNEIYDFAHGCEVNEIVSNGGVDSLVFAGGVTYVHDVNNNDLVINYGDNKTVTLTDYFAGGHSVININGELLATEIENNVNEIYDFEHGCTVAEITSNGGVDSLLFAEGTEFTYERTYPSTDLIIRYNENTLTLKDYFAGNHSVININGELLATEITNNVNEIYDFAHGCEVNEIVSNGGVDSLVFAGGVTYVHDVNNDDLVINYGNDKTVTLTDYFAGGHSAQFINGVAVATAIANNVNEIYDFANGCEVAEIVANGGVDSLVFAGGVTYVHDVNNDDLVIKYGDNKTVTIADYFAGNHSVQFINGVAVANAIANNVNEIYDFANGCDVTTINANGGVDTLVFADGTELTYERTYPSNDLIIKHNENVLTLKDYFLGNHSVTNIDGTIDSEPTDYENLIIGGEWLAARQFTETLDSSDSAYFVDDIGDNTVYTVDENGQATAVEGTRLGVDRTWTETATSVINSSSGGVTTMISVGETTNVRNAYRYTDAEGRIFYVDQEANAGVPSTYNVYQAQNGMIYTNIGTTPVNPASEMNVTFNRVHSLTLEGSVKDINLGGTLIENAEVYLGRDGKTYYHDATNNIWYEGDTNTGYSETVPPLSGGEIENLIANNINEIYDFANGCEVAEIVANGGVDSLIFADNVTYVHNLSNDDLVINYGENQTVTIADYFLGNHSVQFINGVAVANVIANNVNEIYDFAQGCEVDEITANGGLDTLKFAENTELTYTHDLENNDLVISYGENQVVTLKDYFAGAHSVQAVQIGNETMSISDNIDENGMTIIGTDDAEEIIGTYYDDVITGNKGNDTISGGVGNDTYVFDALSGDGNDVIMSDNGLDTIEFKNGNGIKLTYVHDVSNNDLVIYYDYTAPYGEADSVTLKDYFLGNHSVQLIKIGDETLNIADEIENGIILKNSGTVDSISGGDIDDVIINSGTVSGDIIGGLGNDTITNNGTAMYITGDEGDDVITNNGTVSEYISGGVGNDTLKGGVGNSTFRFEAGDGNDVVLSSEGNDTLLFEAGTDLTCIHDLSNDDLVISYGENDNVTIKDYFAGDHSVQTVKIGNETFNLADLIENNLNEIYDFAGGCEVNEITSNGGVDTLKFSENAELTYIHDMDSNDLVISYGENERVTIKDYFLGEHSVQSVQIGEETLDIADELEKGMTILGSREAKIYRGTDGKDYISEWANGSIHEVRLGDGNDTFSNYNYNIENTAIYGEDGNDDIVVENGSYGNSIIGGQGNDFIASGGDNLMIFNNSDGHDVIGLIGGNRSNGTLKFADSLLSDLTLEKYGNELLIKYNNGQDSVKVQSYENSSLMLMDNSGEDAISLNEFIANYVTEHGELPVSTDTVYTGTDGDDYINNFNNPNITEINLGDGNDEIFNWDNELTNTTISGGDGNDYINIGWGSNNTIVGGQGNDCFYMEMADADNTFVFNKGDGNDIVSGSGGKLNFADSDLSDLTLEKFGESSIFIKYNNGQDSVRVTEYDMATYTITDQTGATVTLSDFIADYGELPVSTETVMYGTDGNDQIRGIGGSNIKEVRMGAGDDELRTMEAYSKTIYGEDGNDYISIDCGENNKIIGGQGNDYLSIMGENTFIFNNGDGNDTLSETSNGRLKFNDSSLEDIYAESYGHDILLKYNGGQDSIRIQEFGSNSFLIVDKDGREIDLFEFVDQNRGLQRAKGRVYEGTSGDDYVRDLNNSGINEVNLGDGNDEFIIDGSDINNTTINGGAGNDRISLTMWGERNTVIGGTGNDYLFAEGGEDTRFIFNNGDGQDIVGAWSQGILKFNDTSLDDLTVEKYGETALKIKYNNGQDSVLVQEYEASNLMLEGKDGGAIQLQDFIQHYGEKFSFTGTDGDDTVIELTNTNLKEVHLGAGNDKFISETGNLNNAVIYGEDGHDRISVFGENNTITGGQGNDFIYTSGMNTVVLNNGDGHDSIVSDGCALKFTGVSLDDLSLEKYGTALKIKYNNGQDSVMINGYENSWFSISDKNGRSVELSDFIMSYGEIPESNSVEITGTANDDYIRTVDWQDGMVVAGRAKLGSNSGEAIYLEEQINNANINAGDGNDYISVSGNNNLVQGGNGNDRISVGGDNCTIIGGQGNDYVVLDGNDNTLILNNGDGNDIFAYWAGGIFKFADSDLSDLTLEKYGKGLLIKYNNGQDSVMIQDYQNTVGGIVISDKNGDEVALSNFIANYGEIPVSTDTVFNGTDTDDHIDYFQNSNVKEINLGAGNDVIYSSDADGEALNNSVINGGDGNDELGIFEGDNNVINGGAGNDKLYSWGNNNTIIGGLGNDCITSEGNNIMVFNKGDGNDVLAMGTQGTLKFADSDLTDLTLEKFGEAMYIKYNNGQDSVLVNYYGTANLTIVDQNGESISAQEFFMEYPDIVELPESTETVFNGTDEDDYLFEFNSSNISEINLGSGDDEFVVMNGQVENIVINGGDGNDRISVDMGMNDTIIGGQGNDYIRANIGQESLILFNNGDGHDTIGKWSDATLKFADSELSDLTLEKYGENELLIKYNNGQDSVLVQDYQGSNINLADKNGESVSLYNFVEGYNDGEIPESTETVYIGTDNDDYIADLENRNIKEVRLGAGSDKYISQDMPINNLTVYGGDGNDCIICENCNGDILVGGRGDDYLRVNGGEENTMVFFNGDGHDIIGQYSEGTLKFADSLLSELTLEKYGENSILIKYNNGQDSVVVQGYDGGMFRIADKYGITSTLDEWGFINLYKNNIIPEKAVIKGTSGDDIIYDAKMNNYIEAGAGNNTIYFAQGNGYDIVTAGTGRTTLLFDYDPEYNFLDIMDGENGSFNIYGYSENPDDNVTIKMPTVALGDNGLNKLKDYMNEGMLVCGLDTAVVEGSYGDDVIYMNKEGIGTIISYNFMMYGGYDEVIDSTNKDSIYVGLGTAGYSCSREYDDLILKFWTNPDANIETDFPEGSIRIRRYFTQDYAERIDKLVINNIERVEKGFVVGPQEFSIREFMSEYGDSTIPYYDGEYNVINGKTTDDFELAGTSANDIINGNGGSDIISGRRGDDIINITHTEGIVENNSISYGISYDDMEETEYIGGHDVINGANNNDMLDIFLENIPVTMRYKQIDNDLKLEFYRGVTYQVEGMSPIGSITITDYYITPENERIDIINFNANGQDHMQDLMSLTSISELISKLPEEDYNIIEGTENDEVLNGTASSDVIYGNGGNDTISGGLGNDLIFVEHGETPEGNVITYNWGDNDGNALDGGHDVIYGGNEYDTLCINLGSRLATIKYHYENYNMVIELYEGVHDDVRGLSPAGSVTIKDYNLNITQKSIRNLVINSLNQEHIDYLHDGENHLSFNILDGTEKGESIMGTELDETINGNGGGDYLNGRGGNDVINITHNPGVVERNYIFHQINTLNPDAILYSGYDVINGSNNYDRLSIMMTVPVTIRYAQKNDDLMLLFYEGVYDDVQDKVPTSSVTITDYYAVPQAQRLDAIIFEARNQSHLDFWNGYYTNNYSLSEWLTQLTKLDAAPVLGTEGDDIFVVNNDTGSLFIFNSSGNDTVQFESDADLSYTHNLANDDLVINYNENDSVTIKDYFANENQYAPTVKVGEETLNIFDELSTKGATIQNNGTVDYMFGYAGNDNIINNGTVNNNIVAGDGDDVITNNGTVLEGIYGGGGNDTYNISNLNSSTTIIASEGNDTLNIYANKSDLNVLFNIKNDGMFAEGNDKLFLVNDTDYNTWKTTGENPTSGIVIEGFDSIETIKSQDNYQLTNTAQLKSDVAAWLTANNFADVSAVFESGTSDQINDLVAIFDNADWQQMV